MAASAEPLRMDGSMRNGFRCNFSVLCLAAAKGLFGFAHGRLSFFRNLIRIGTEADDAFSDAPMCIVGANAL